MPTVSPRNVRATNTGFSGTYATRVLLKIQLG